MPFAGAFWNIVKLNIKIFAQHKMRVILLFLLIAVLSLMAGLLANVLLTGSNITGPVSIAIVDLDDSFETRMILSVIMENAQDYDGLLMFSQHTAESAHTALHEGYVSAIISLPENFGSAMITGENIPFIVTYNAERPLSASIIRVSANAFADMLRTSQMGVYVTLNYAHAQDIPRESFDMIFMGVNMRFLGFVLNRGDMFVIDEQSVTGGLLIWQSYFIAAYIALMICAAFVMTDALRRNFSRHCLISLKNRGVSAYMVFGAGVFAYFLLFAVLNGALWLLSIALAAAVDLPPFIMSARLLASIIVITISLSTFAAMLSFVFDNALSAGIFTAVFASVSLFLSGGIVPAMYFSDGLRAMSNFAWSTWGTSLLAAAILDEAIVLHAIMSIVFALIFTGIGCAAAVVKGRPA